MRVIIYHFFLLSIIMISCFSKPPSKVNNISSDNIELEEDTIEKKETDSVLIENRFLNLQLNNQNCIKEHFKIIQNYKENSYKLSPYSLEIYFVEGNDTLINCFEEILNYILILKKEENIIKKLHIPCLYKDDVSFDNTNNILIIKHYSSPVGYFQNIYFFKENSDIKIFVSGEIYEHEKLLTETVNFNTLEYKVKTQEKTIEIRKLEIIEI